jgi:hypothetical protein
MYCCDPEGVAAVVITGESFIERGNLEGRQRNA